MDLQKILNQSGLRSEHVARQLYPENKHPYNAFLRVLNGKSQLNATQIMTLCDLTGLTPNELLNAGARWTGSLKNGTITLRVGEHVVEYTSALNVYELRRVTAGLTQFVGTFTVPAGITVKNFLELINNQINNS
jgi:hypothetical protein